MNYSKNLPKSTTMDYHFYSWNTDLWCCILYKFLRSLLRREISYSSFRKKQWQQNIKLWRFQLCVLWWWQEWIWPFPPIGRDMNKKLIGTPHCALCSAATLPSVKCSVHFKCKAYFCQRVCCADGEICVMLASQTHNEVTCSLKYTPLHSLLGLVLLFHWNYMLEGNS